MMLMNDAGSSLSEAKSLNFRFLTRRIMPSHNYYVVEVLGTLIIPGCTITS